MKDNLEVVMGMAVPFYSNISKSLYGLGQEYDDSVCLVYFPNTDASSLPLLCLGIKQYLAKEEKG